MSGFRLSPVIIGCKCRLDFNAIAGCFGSCDFIMVNCNEVSRSALQCMCDVMYLVSRSAVQCVCDVMYLVSRLAVQCVCEIMYLVSRSAVQWVCCYVPGLPFSSLMCVLLCSWSPIQQFNACVVMYLVSRLAVQCVCEIMYLVSRSAVQCVWDVMYYVPGLPFSSSMSVLLCTWSPVQQFNVCVVM